MEELQGKTGAGEDGHRGEGGTWERGEKRGVSSPGGVGLEHMGVPWVDEWELAWSITRHPQLAKVQGWDSQGRSTTHQNQLNSQGVTDQLWGSLPSRGQSRVSSFAASLIHLILP